MISLDAQIMLRLFVETNNLSTAELLANTLIQAIQSYGKVENYQIEQYWKISEYYEVSLAIKPLINISTAFEQIASYIAEDWQDYGSDDRSCLIWNQSEQTSSFCSELRWANLEIMLKIV
ncbi:MAG: hypothetical protein ACK44G_16455 [Aphanizomenon sp.]|jgi:hypothetical protein